jgi:glycosyltransferase 2 family protein
MTFRRALPWLVFAAIAALIAWRLHASHFDWAGFARSLSTADIRLLGLAILVIWSNNVIRALRWAVFLRPTYKASGLPPTPWHRLIGSQFIGFTGLAIFGRIGELIRPLLIARRTRLTFASQVAVVTVERVFDLGAFGLIFALNLLLSPQLQTLPHLHKAGYTIGALTLVIAVFVAGVRLAGELVARIAGGLIGIMSKPAGAAVADKILAFRNGLNVIDTLPDFLLTVALSLALWATIAAAYLLTLKAFPPPVHDLTLGHTIVLMGFSVAGSALPIPGGGGAWAGNVFALASLFQIPSDLAASAGLLVWLVTSMAVIPAGLVFARVERVSLKSVSDESSAQPSATTL